MRLVARELPLRPDPLALARRLQSFGDLALLWSADGSGDSYLGVDPVLRSSAFDPEPSFELAHPDNLLGYAPRWIGLLPYEACRDLERPGRGRIADLRAEPHLSAPLWLRFGAVVCIGQRVLVVGDDAGSVERLSRRLLAAAPVAPGAVTLDPSPGEAPERHAERVRAALNLIVAGEIYQVNLARRLDFRATGSSLDLLARLCLEQRPAYAAAFTFDAQSVVCTSPELLLHQSRSGVISTRPIKGTRPRGTDRVGDARWAAELAQDPKEQAELSMVIDVERNDVGRVSRVGSVRVHPASVSAHGPVWHRAATVIGRLRAGVARTELLKVMLPSGSVTGAPKIRAMEIIAQLEAERRGLYTGGLGFLNHRGELTLAMAIRTLTVKDGVGHYFAGGGIVADSQPELEVRETLWKARQLFGRAV
jgi:anthranilate/para-aminobenzoate synthase component I